MSISRPPIPRFIAVTVLPKASLNGVLERGTGTHTRAKIGLFDLPMTTTPLIFEGEERRQFATTKGYDTKTSCNDIWGHDLSGLRS